MGKHKKNNNLIPERSGCTLSDDEDMDNIIKNKKRKRPNHDNYDNDEHPTKRQKLSNIESMSMDEDIESEEDMENMMDIEVGTGHGYLIAVGQTSSKTKTGWALSFNPQHSGMFVTGNGDGSIAVWDLNMIDNKECMTKMGKFKNKKNSNDPQKYMKDSKIRHKTFNDGPPFITRQRSDE